MASDYGRRQTTSSIRYMRLDMRASDLLRGVSCLSPRIVSLALRRRSELRTYISCCLRKYDELAGTGLPCRKPPIPAHDGTIVSPSLDARGGGMSDQELVVLARTTKALKPKTIFEFGTYNGLTTAVFLLNSPPNTRILTLDLPLDAKGSAAAMAADQLLVASRDLASVPATLGISDYTQLLCDSMSFDISAYLNCVDLGLIDAAHDLAHVRNDTEKMVRMMTEEGILFWHDYGGRGITGPLSSYLERLGKRTPLYRVIDTQLAWAPASGLKRLFGCPS